MVSTAARVIVLPTLAETVVHVMVLWMATLVGARRASTELTVR